MAHDDKKWTKGMTPAQKEKFENQDKKNDSKLADKIKSGYMSTAKVVRSKEKDLAVKSKEKPAAKKAEAKKKPKKK